jgi:hypothetical protein
MKCHRLINIPVLDLPVHKITLAQFYKTSANCLFYLTPTSLINYKYTTVMTGFCWYSSYITFELNHDFNHKFIFIQICHKTFNVSISVTNGWW